VSAPAAEGPRPPRARRVRFALELGGLRLIIATFRALPSAAALALGAALGRFTYSVVRLRRRVALDNVRRTIGRDWPEPRVRAVVRATYENFGRLPSTARARDGSTARTSIATSPSKGSSISTRRSRAEGASSW